MLASRLLVHHHPEDGNPEDNAVFRATRRFFDWLQGRYGKGLDWALHHRGPVLLSLLGAVILNGFLIGVAPKGFFPSRTPARSTAASARGPVDQLHRHEGQADPDREDRARRSGHRYGRGLQRRQPRGRRFPLRDAETARRAPPPMR
jgi:hypothetical protein